MTQPDHASSGPAVPLAAALTAMVSVQVGAALAKSMFAAAGAPGAVTLRVVLAALILILVQRPWSWRLSGAQLRLVLPYGLTLGVMNLCFYQALTTLPLGVVVTLEFLGPLGVALAGSRRPRDLVWVGLALAGVLLMHTPSAGTRLDPIGLLLALAAGLCWGLYIVFGKRAGGLGAARATTLGMVIAALTVLPVGWMTTGARLWDPALLPRGLAVAVLSSALPYSLEMFAMHRLARRSFGILMSLEPAIAALLGLVVLGESLSATQVLAIACVIAATLGSVTGWKPAAPPLL